MSAWQVLLVFAAYAALASLVGLWLRGRRSFDDIEATRDKARFLGLNQLRRKPDGR